MVYEVQVVHPESGAETWIPVEAETMRHAQSLAGAGGGIVGDVRARAAATVVANPSPTAQAAAQGTAIVTWGIISIVVIALMLTFGAMYGRML